MDVLEKEIEDVIWDGLINQRELIEDRGLYLESNEFYRQYDLGEYGIADIIGNKIDPVNKTILWEVIEIKKSHINYKTLEQAVRYGRALQLLSAKYFTTIYIKINLIGKSLDTDYSFCYLNDLFPEINLITYKIDLINGITFKHHHGYAIANTEGFLKRRNQFIQSLAKYTESV